MRSWDLIESVSEGFLPTLRCVAWVLLKMESKGKHK